MLRILYLESNLTNFLTKLFFREDFEAIIQASDFKISPSLRTLRLFALRVSPDEVMSVIISDDPVKG